MDDIKLHGDTPARRFYIEVTGGVVGNHKATELGKALKTITGKWKEFSATSVTGAIGPLYLNPDRSPRTQRMEFQTKRLKQILERSYPKLAFWPNRSKGEVKLDRIPVARVLVPDVPDTPSKIEWNHPEAARVAICKESVEAEFKRIFDAPAEVQWS